MTTTRTLTQRLASASGISESDQELAIKLRRLSKSSRDGTTLAHAARRIEVMAKRDAAFQSAVNQLDSYFEYRTAANLEKWTEQSRTQVFSVIGKLREALEKAK